MPVLSIRASSTRDRVSHLSAAEAEERCCEEVEITEGKVGLSSTIGINLFK